MKDPLDAVTLGPGHYSLLDRGRSYEVFVREEKEGWIVEIEGHRVPVRREIPSGKKTSEGESGGPAVISSPMPGRVIAIKVKVGTRVKEGEGVVIVSAMKMENEIIAPRSGRVTKVSVKEGETVEGGQELVVIG